MRALARRAGRGGGARRRPAPASGTRGSARRSRRRPSPAGRPPPRRRRAGPRRGSPVSRPSRSPSAVTAMRDDVGRGDVAADDGGAERAALPRAARPCSPSTQLTSSVARCAEARRAARSGVAPIAAMSAKLRAAALCPTSSAVDQSRRKCRPSMSRSVEATTRPSAVATTAASSPGPTRVVSAAARSGRHPTDQAELAELGDGDADSLIGLARARRPLRCLRYFLPVARTGPPPGPTAATTRSPLHTPPHARNHRRDRTTRPHEARTGHGRDGVHPDPDRGRQGRRRGDRDRRRSPASPAPRTSPGPTTSSCAPRPTTSTSWASWSWPTSRRSAASPAR